MTVKTIDLSIDMDGIALLVLDVPGRSMNLLTPALRVELQEAVGRVREDANIKGAIITSARRTSFLAGADLHEFLAEFETTTLEEAYQRSVVFRSLELVGKPIAAAINGLALGAGLELALACHYRVLADDSGAVIGLPEVRVGLLPGAGGTQRLPRLIGIPQALPLLLEGRHLSPDEALRLGVVDATVPTAQILTRAREWILKSPRSVQPWDVKGFSIPDGAGCLSPHAVRSFQAGTARLSQSTQRNYPAPLAILSAVFEGTQLPIDVGLRIESKYFARLLTHPVARNLIRTMFVNKGAADRLHSRPAEPPKFDVTRLGVVGGGLMGSGIACAAGSAGIHVTMVDATQELADQGLRHAAEFLKKDLRSGKIDQEAHDRTLSKIVVTADYTALRDCDLVVEAVFELRDLKTRVIRRVEAVTRESAVIATNTSTLPITGLAEAGGRPERFIGIHFFSPVQRMPLVEVIVGQRTSRETLAHALDFVRALRKTPIVVNDSPGFYTSRLFMAYIDEGMCMLAQGVNPALIENAGRLTGMALGPLVVTDEVSIELQLKVLDQAIEDGLPERRLRRHAESVIRSMITCDRLGRRHGRGFYDYPAGSNRQLWPGLNELFPIAADQPDLEVVKTRLLYIQAIEAARCLEEGVVDHPADADLGAVLGLGFPSYTGGPLSMIDTIGVDVFFAECRALAERYGERFMPSTRMLARGRENQRFYEK
jgi:3-hydroxyacyl-CoA dehydrogenase / enoyl-CoA hydratase / 3-hydroxybutyryl-CoA epimerase